MVRRTGRAIAAAWVPFALLLVGGVAVARAAPAPLLRSPQVDRIDGRYIVVLKEAAGTASVDRVARTARNEGGRIDHRYRRALKGFSAELSPAALAEVRDDPAVAFVEPDARISLQTTQNGATWGLDRIDQPDLPLNATYNYTPTGDGVSAYIIDTGIRATHQEFGGRAVTGTDVIDGGPADDCNGHGTHVAGTVGGSTYGVAKDVKLVAVRVFDCSGSTTESAVAAGVDWVTADHTGSDPAVANMSLGGYGPFLAIEQAVDNSIADGVTYTISAGNSAWNACEFSPARVPAAITVGASVADDTGAYFTNYGPCVDVFAPGMNITSAWMGSDTQTNTISGTSMAAPHVAGVAALRLQAAPSSSPAEIATAISNGSVVGRLTGIGTGSPNRLLQSLAGRYPTMAAAASPGIALGAGTLTNTATVTQLVDPQPDASIDFRLYGPDETTCSGSPVFESLDVPYPVDGGPVTSAPFTPVNAGTYRWRVTYSGDANNSPVTASCGAAAQAVTVAKAPTTIALTPSPQITIGAGTLHATGAVNGRVSPRANAAVTFVLFEAGNTDCSAPVIFGSPVDYPPGAGTVSSESFTPTHTGTYHWRASYSGDANNAPATTACSPTENAVVVAQATPVLDTSPSPNGLLGSVRLSNTVDLVGEAGLPSDATIDFRLYGPNGSCSDVPVFQSLDLLYAGGPVSSETFMPTQPGTYRWLVTYSGDANNAPTVHCGDSVEVTRWSPPVTSGWHPLPTAKPDTSIDFRLTGSAKQRPLRNTRGLAVKVSCPQELCVAEVSGTVTVPAAAAAKKAKKYRLKRVKVAIVDGKPIKLKLKFARGLRRDVARALASRRTRNGVKAHLKATASDAAVNRQTRKLTVRVHR